MLEGCNETQSGQMGSGQWNVDTRTHTHVQLAEEEDASLAASVKSSPCQKKKMKYRQKFSRLAEVEKFLQW